MSLSVGSPAPERCDAVAADSIAAPPAHSPAFGVFSPGDEQEKSSEGSCPPECVRPRRPWTAVCSGTAAREVCGRCAASLYDGAFRSDSHPKSGRPNKRFLIDSPNPCRAGSAPDNARNLQHRSARNRARCTAAERARAVKVRLHQRSVFFIVNISAKTTYACLDQRRRS